MLEVKPPQSLGQVVSFPSGKRISFKEEAVKAKFTGPLSGSMWKRVSKLESRYNDNFDWGIYDRLFLRHGDNQPRGGVIFKSGLKLVNFHPTCTKCHHSFEIDTYGRGCVHDCAYCYAKDKLTVHGYWNKPFPMPIDLSEIRKIFFDVFESDVKSKWRSILMNRIPLRIGSMSDSFMWMDQKYRVSYELLKILDYYKYPYIIFTRSDLISTEEYLNVLNPDLAAIHFSISGGNEEITRKLEPGAPSVKRRLKSLKTLNENGFHTTVRINPLFPTFPDGYLSNPEKMIERFGEISRIPKFDLLDITNLDPFFNSLSDAKVDSVVAGFVRLKTSMINRMSTALDFNFKDFFSPEVIFDGQGRNREKKFSDLEISQYYKILKETCDRYSMRFNTCYIGNGVKDYFQYQDLWSNKNDCCDAISRVKAFKNSSQSISWETRSSFAPSKEIADKAKEELSRAELEFGDRTVRKTPSAIRPELPL